MQARRLDPRNEQILILTPTGQDGPLVAGVLEAGGLDARVCRNVTALCAAIEEGAGAAIVAEEALAHGEAEVLLDVLRQQPTWSDFPIIVLSSGAGAAQDSLRPLRLLGPMANLTLLERPLRTVTLLSAVQVALRARRRQYEVRDLLDKQVAILSSVTDGFVSFDSQWQFTYVNPAAERIYQRSSADLVGKVYWKEFPYLRDTLVEREFLRAVEEQTTVEFQFHSSKADAWFNVKGYPTASGGLTAYFDDITERRKTEAALQKAREQLARHADDLEKTVAERTARLRESVGELEAFSYTISHDLRAPLRAMQSYAQALLEDCSDAIGDLGREYIERIKRAGLRMDKMILDVLNYSRIVRTALQLEPVHTDKLVKDIIQSYSSLQIAGAKIEVQTPLHPVLAHEASLVQCLSNLLNNALKFVPPERNPHVTIRTERLDGQVRIWVEDNGIGIAESKKERLFRMFERVHSENGFEGTGIGLAIVRKATERMGGTWGVESEAGVGSRFWIQLQKAEIE